MRGRWRGRRCDAGGRYQHQRGAFDFVCVTSSWVVCFPSTEEDRCPGWVFSRADMYIQIGPPVSVSKIRILVRRCETSTVSYVVTRRFPQLSSHAIIGHVTYHGPCIEFSELRRLCFGPAANRTRDTHGIPRGRARFFQTLGRCRSLLRLPWSIPPPSPHFLTCKTNCQNRLSGLHAVCATRQRFCNDRTDVALRPKCSLV
jgi:hypothetical protein